MSSATALEPRPGPLHGLLLGACAGACTGLADALRAVLAGTELVQPRDALAVVGFYAAAFALPGAAAVWIARRFDWPHRALNLLIAVGAAWCLFVAWLNVAWLPGFLSGTSIAVDLLSLGAAAAVFAILYRRPGEDAIPTRRWVIAGVGAAVLAAAVSRLAPARDDGPAPQAAASPDAPRVNVLVYLVDTLRADHLGLRGYDRKTSPEIDAFAAESVTFADCRAPTSWTKPSVASLFTSLYPTAHACIEQRDVLVPAAETMAEIFRAAGRRTAAFVDNPFISPEFGFAQGFDLHDGVRPSVVVNGTLLGKVLFTAGVLSLVGVPFDEEKHADRGCAALHRALLSWLDETDKSEAPWFAYVHAMEPHGPYEPARDDAEAMGLPPGARYRKSPAWTGILPFDGTPEPPADLVAALRAQYDGEIRGLSREFGALVAELRRQGVLERTIVVFCADHGEEFHEHGGWRHGHSLHGDVVDVPLIVRLPEALGPRAAASRGRRVGGVASLLDVLPTLVELCGLRAPQLARMRCGTSLAPQILGGPGAPEHAPDRVLLGEVTMSPVGIRSIRDGRWLLTVAREPMREAVQLFDDVSDPAHRRERQDDEFVEVRRLRGLLDDAFVVLRAAALSGASREIDPETTARLRAIGYVSGK